MKNFKHDTTVKFINTNSPLDGVIGQITGIAQDFGDYSHYIIQCQEPINGDFTAVAITEHCLEEVPEENLTPPNSKERLAWWKSLCKDHTFKEVALKQEIKAIDWKIERRNNTLKVEVVDDPIETEIKSIMDKINRETILLLEQIKGFLESKR